MTENDDDLESSIYLPHDKRMARQRELNGFRSSSLNAIAGMTVLITPATLPKGTWWDDDGAAFEAVRTTAGVDDARDWWRWRPVNGRALAKGEPDKPMHPFMPIQQTMLRQ